uniref:Uncharacterized protein n=1 Tax=Utricularia reniformis TaxID=192314 RepID=A0A1Y0B4L7_9LAMI|nr:hypothetical protein AEK19_MT2180 [Utricularia reniformis]ART32327.1 hypothetical protein AEK19_MT2180 [Utricularia reniformis]
MSILTFMYRLISLGSDQLLTLTEGRNYAWNEVMIPRSSSS